MAMPDLDILRDIDARLAELRLELRLHRQEFRFYQKATAERFRAMDAKLSELPTAHRMIVTYGPVLLRAGFFLALLLAGKPIGEAVLTSLKIG